MIAIIRILTFMYVIFLYATYPTFHLTVTETPHTLYQYLTEAFLAGHLHLMVSPSPELLHLSNPYDPTLNVHYKLFDASLYQGQYYLYFGPLPVIFFYLPFKLLSGYYPTDAFATFFFLSLGFLFAFMLLIKIKNTYFASTSESQVRLAVALLGFCNGGPFLLSRPMAYEAAIASAFCFMSIALYLLFQILTKRYRALDLFGFSLCLSLCVAGRPHFVLVCVVLFFLLLIQIHKMAPKVERLKKGLCLLGPALSLGIMLGLYNYQRFGNVFDFGHFWQLSCNNIQALHLELLDITKIPRNLFYGFYYYFLQALDLIPIFPFVTLRWHEITYHIGDYFLEGVAGILITTPFILMLLGFPKSIQGLNTSLRSFVMMTCIVPFINGVFIMLLPFAVQRYEVDFVPYLILLSILTFWQLQNIQPLAWFRKTMQIYFVTSGIYSICVGLALGLAYWRVYHG